MVLPSGPLHLDAILAETGVFDVLSPKGGRSISPGENVTPDHGASFRAAEASRRNANSSER